MMLRLICDFSHSHSLRSFAVTEFSVFVNRGDGIFCPSSSLSIYVCGCVGLEVSRDKQRRVDDFNIYGVSVFKWPKIIIKMAVKWMIGVREL